MATTLPVIHALIDMVVAYDDDATEEQNDRAVQTAFNNLNDVEALTATFDDETDVLTLEATPLLTAIAVTVDTLVRQVALQFNQDRETILAVLREHLDGVYSGNL